MASSTIHDRMESRKRDDYTQHRFEWLDQVAADPELAASGFKVAYAIATSLWRNKGTVTLVTPKTKDSDNVREAWIGTREIADKIGMSRFTVMTMVDRLKERGHLEVDAGKQGRGHANHYRLVRKGEPANLLKGKQSKLKGAHSSLFEGAKDKPKAKPKGAPANLLDGEKVSPRTSRGAPTHLIPLNPYEVPSEIERGAPQARQGTGASGSSIGSRESLGRTHGTIDDDDRGVGCRPPPPNHLARAIARARRLQIQGGGQ